jgi:UDP-N-acetylmuramoyl-tripeptide--D-alanyl-D-alanine ligase
VSSDSRTLGPGALFVALRGPNFDGAEFVAAAAARGAVGALVDRAMPVALPQIIVPDTLRALQRLAAAGAPTSIYPSWGSAAATARPRRRK